MNIPIFSYIFLGGKCHYCKKPIGFVYFFTELLCAVLFALNYYLYGFTANFFITTIISCVLVVTIVSDFLYYYISDRVLVISTILLIIILYIFNDATFVLKSILNGALMFGVMYAIKMLGNYLFKRESLGDGDIKLMGVVALAIGILPSFIALFLASVIGILYSLLIKNINKEGIIPFGPFLIMGALLSIYFSESFDIFIHTILLK